MSEKYHDKFCDEAHAHEVPRCCSASCRKCAATPPTPAPTGEGLHDRVVTHGVPCETCGGCEWVCADARRTAPELCGECGAGEPFALLCATCWGLFTRRDCCRTAPEPSPNQCDGCRRGLPVERGIHSGGEYDLISCTADRYAPAPSPVMTYRDCPCPACEATREQRHTSDNAHSCCVHDPKNRECCDNMRWSAPSPDLREVAMPDQRSVTDQLRDLVDYANKHGMYDAADFIADKVGTDILARHFGRKG